MSVSATESLELVGELKGHSGWVTSIATSRERPNMILSASRDKSIIMWNLTRDEEKYGYPQRRLTGHSHYVEEVTMSSDGQYALSGSWDGTLRLWELATGKTTRRFTGHKGDVLSVAFSHDNRQIVSASRDKTIKLWNTVGQCKLTLDGHSDWVSCVRFSPDEKSPNTIVSAGWDSKVCVWKIPEPEPIKEMTPSHEGNVNTVAISPDGSLCATGGKDGVAKLWTSATGALLSELDAGDVINTLIFSPTRYWLCVATGSSIKIWNLESKHLEFELKLESSGEPSAASKKAIPIQCISLAWGPNGSTLYAGYTDNVIRVYEIRK